MPVNAGEEPWLRHSGNTAAQRSGSALPGLAGICLGKGEAEAPSEKSSAHESAIVL